MQILFYFILLQFFTVYIRDKYREVILDDELCLDSHVCEVSGKLRVSEL